MVAFGALMFFYIKGNAINNFLCAIQEAIANSCNKQINILLFLIFMFAPIPVAKLIVEKITKVKLTHPFGLSWWKQMTGR